MVRPSPSTLIGRALRLKCPRCGRGRLFTGLFRMNQACPSCNLVFEREPGFFLGSIYINYGLTAVLTTIGWLVLRYRFQIAARPLAFSLLAFCVLFGGFFFRYARALWLAMDCRFESDQFFDLSIPSDRAPTVPVTGAIHGRHDG